MRLTITYDDAARFLSDLDELRARSGILVRVQDRELVPGSALEVALETPGGVAVVTATVIQPIAGQGVAISFDADSDDVARISRGSPGPSPGPSSGPSGGAAEPVTAQWAEPAPAGPSERRRAPAATDMPVRERIKSATKVEKMQMALRGSREERSLLIRDRDKSLHQYVIRNPKIGLDEVAAIARMSTVAPDVLKLIAGRRDWFQRPEVASGLCRNPKVSPVVARKMLAFVPNQELRQMAKGNGVREAIAAEARRRLFQSK